MKNMTHRHVFLILSSEYLKVCDIMPKIPNQSCTKAFLVNLLTSKLKNISLCGTDQVLNLSLLLVI